MELFIKVKQVFKKLYSYIWFRTVLYIIIFLILYAIRERVHITNNTRTILNLVLLGAFFVQLYQRLNEKKISVVRFLFILITAFILNKFYDSNIFFGVFKIELNYALITIGSAIFLYIIGFKIFRLIKNKHRKKVDLKFKNKGVLPEGQEEVVASIASSNEHYDIDGFKNNTNNVNSQTNFDQDVKPQINYNQNGEDQINHNQNVGPETQTNVQNMKSQTGLIILMCCIILLFSILSIFPLFNKNMIDKLNSLEASNGLSVYISLIGLFFLCIFMWAVVVTVFIRLIRIILNIIKNKDSQSNYLLNACAFLTVSFFITKQYNISLDKIIDSIIQGNILSFPILILILLPLFFTLLQNLETLIRKNGELKEKTTKLIYGLIFGIIEALLNFIKFTTADFLISIQDIVREDLDNEKETDKPLGENLGEQENGTANTQSRESKADASK